MTVTPADHAPVQAAPRVPERASRAARRERRVALVVVLVPSAALVIAAVLLWQGRVSRVDLGLLAGMYVLTMLGVGVGLHRQLSHGSFRTYPAVRAGLAALGSMAAQGPVYYWVAVHRRHHAHSDGPGDPHSPRYGFSPGFSGAMRGFWHAHTGWMFDHEPDDWPRYIPDLLRDRLLFRVNRLYILWVVLGLAVPAMLGGLLTGTRLGAATGLLWGGLVRVALVHHAAWSLGSVSHVFGASPYPTRDHSTNNAWTALLTFGESWHNNHHAFPTSASHGIEWWQVDLNAWLIRGLQLTGLAWDVKSPPPRAVRQARKARPDFVEPQLPPDRRDARIDV